MRDFAAFFLQVVVGILVLAGMYYLQNYLHGDLHESLYDIHTPLLFIPIVAGMWLLFVQKRRTLIFWSIVGTALLLIYVLLPYHVVTEFRDIDIVLHFTNIAWFGALAYCWMRLRMNSENQ